MRLSAEALALIREYPWPGNIRELKNVIQRAAVLCDGGVILPEHLPAALLDRPSQEALSARIVSDAHTDTTACSTFDCGLLEREQIAEALRQCAGNQTRAARLLGISRGTLIARLAALGFLRPRKRVAAAYVS